MMCLSPLISAGLPTLMSWDLHNPNLSFTFNFGKVGNLVLAVGFLFQTSRCHKIDREVEPLQNQEL